MSNHNHLLGQGGCDGLKTGYFKAGGYSSLTTAARDGRRVVVAVTGSPSRAIRDQNAARLLADGLARAKPGSARAATITPPVKRAPPTTPDEKTPEAEPLPGKPERRRSGVWSKLGLIGIGLVIGLVLAGIGRRRTL